MRTFINNHTINGNSVESDKNHRSYYKQTCTFRDLYQSPKTRVKIILTMGIYTYIREWEFDAGDYEFLDNEHLLSLHCQSCSKNDFIKYWNQYEQEKPFFSLDPPISDSIIQSLILFLWIHLDN